MLGLYDMHAMMWYAAEKHEAHVPWQALPIARKDEIRKRVRFVLEGGVARAQCSIGDLTVLEGHFRITKRMEPPPSEEVEYPHLTHEWRWAHRYDSLEFGQTPLSVCAYTRLFGSTNIGQMNLSNMQVGGSFAPWGLWHNRYSYVTVECFDERHEDLVCKTLQDSKIMTEMGDRPVALNSAWDLFVQPHVVEFQIPLRQNICAVISFFGDAWRKLDHAVRTSCRDAERARARLVVHYEGWESRSVQ